MPATEDPRATRSRALILEASAAVFLERGYELATVDDVAEAAGVVKRTVYNLYGDKEALFRATVMSSIATAERFSAFLADEVRAVADPVAELPGVAERLAESVLCGPVLPLRRLLATESRRFPDLATEYRDRAPEAVMRALADLFGGLAASGRLAVDDAEVAAEHFAFIVMGADLDRGMFHAGAPGRRRVRARARTGAAAFLRAYRV